MRRDDRFKSRDLRNAEAVHADAHSMHTWDVCASRGTTTATYPASGLPHNCFPLACDRPLGKHEAGECSCAWCGEPSPVNAEAHP